MLSFLILSFPSFESVVSYYLSPCRHGFLRHKKQLHHNRGHQEHVCLLHEILHIKFCAESFMLISHVEIYCRHDYDFKNDIQPWQVYDTG